MFKNWKTTLAGLLVAAVNLHANGLSWDHAICSAGFAALGILAKDATTD